MMKLLVPVAKPLQQAGHHEESSDFIQRVKSDYELPNYAQKFIILI